MNSKILVWSSKTRTDKVKFIYRASWENTAVADLCCCKHYV